MWLGGAEGESALAWGIQGWKDQPMKEGSKPMMVALYWRCVCVGGGGGDGGMGNLWVKRETRSAKGNSIGK